MEVLLSIEQTNRMKHETKRSLNRIFVVFLIFYSFLIFVYAILRITNEPKSSSGLIVISFGFSVSIIDILYINAKVNKCFKNCFYKGDNVIEYEATSDYLYIHNYTTKSENRIYTVSIKKIIDRPHCSIVMLVDRDIIVVPKEVNIDVVKKSRYLS